MLYKHWKKVLLSLTAFFWASCDDPASSNTSEEPVSSASVDQPASSAAVTPPGSSASTEGGSSAEATSSAAENPASSEAAAESSDTDTSAASSSDNPNVASSGSVAKSSSDGMIAPKYGVPMSSSMIAPKYGVPMSSSVIAAKYGVPMPVCERFDSKLVCTDGVTCTETVSESTQAPECTGDQLCAKYGVVVVKETTYKCDDGKTYSEAEFLTKYNILDGAVDLYGCPSDICGTDDTTITEVMPLYGIPSNMNSRPN